MTQNTPEKRPYAPQRPDMTFTQSQPPAPRPRISLLALLAAGLVVAQLALPEEKKPMRILGEAAADFYGRLMDESNRKELEMAQQRQIAERMAELQTEYANWQGLCALTALADRQLGAACYQGAEEYFRNAKRQIERSRVHIKP